MGRYLPQIEALEAKQARALPNFRVGDTVRVDDFVGTVESIGMRSTRFRTPDRTLITIPNGKLSDRYVGRR